MHTQCVATVFEFFGIKVRVNLRETEEPHVHCVRGNASVRYSLVRRDWMDPSTKFSKSDLRKIEEQITLRFDECVAEWERLYGEE